MIRPYTREKQKVQADDNTIERLTGWMQWSAVEQEKIRRAKAIYLLQQTRRLGKKAFASRSSGHPGRAGCVARRR